MSPLTSSAHQIDTRSHYRICIRGALDATWSDRLGGLTLAVNRRSDGGAMTILSGELADQSALVGVLNTLHDLGLALESVERDDAWPPDQVLDDNPSAKKERSS
jgi:hypothetical protein